MALMTEQRIRHLPILLDDKLEGIVSIGDIVKEVISKQEFMIEQMKIILLPAVHNIPKILNLVSIRKTQSGVKSCAFRPESSLSDSVNELPDRHSF